MRDKIEQRYARALGSAELAGNSVEGRMLEVQKSTLDMAGASRLDQIRASLGGNQLGCRAGDPVARQGCRHRRQHAAGHDGQLVGDGLSEGLPTGKALAKRLQREAVARARSADQEQRRHSKAVARRERVLRRARQALPVHGVLVLGSAGLVAVGEGPLWLALTAVSGTSVVRAVRTLRRPPPLPAAPRQRTPVPPPPPLGSSVWPELRRLEAVRQQMARLVPLVTGAGREAVEEAWHAAGEADLALRWQAARLAAVEPHRGRDPDLHRSLEAGVRQQEQLVAAVADLVAASADPLGSARLQDATDALHGLASALRELRTPS